MPSDVSAEHGCQSSQPWTSLGVKLQETSERILVAQRKAFEQLRQTVSFAEQYQGRLDDGVTDPPCPNRSVIAKRISRTMRRL
jgi:hypothetical protein